MEATETMLDPQEHWTLKQDIDSVAEMAGIPVAMIHKPMSDFCSEAEVEYIKKLRQQDNAGLVYVGKEDATVRMMAIAGACIRNFIDARVLQLKDVLVALKNGESIDYEVVLIPNFCIASNDRGVADWEMTHVLGWLYDREFLGRPTFLAVSDMDHVQKQMGPLVSNLLRDKYAKF